MFVFDLWTVSLNFSSSRNWSIRKTSSLLRDDMASLSRSQCYNENLGFFKNRSETETKSMELRRRIPRRCVRAREQTGRLPRTKSKVFFFKSKYLLNWLWTRRERETLRAERDESREVGLFMPMLSRFRSFLFFLGFIAFSFYFILILCGLYLTSVIIHF